MAFETDADRLSMLDALGGDHSVTFKGSPVSAIFEKRFAEVNGVEGYHPVVSVRDIDVSGVAHADSVVVDTDSYQVVGIQPDGTGITDLLLEFLTGISASGGFSSGFSSGFA